MKILYALLFLIYLPTSAFAAWEKLPYGYGYDLPNVDTFIDRAKIKRNYSVLTLPVLTNSTGRDGKVRSELSIFQFDCKYPTIVQLKQASYQNSWLRGAKTLEIDTPYDFKGVLFLEKLWEQLCGRSLPATKYLEQNQNQQGAINEQIRANQKLLRQLEREIEMDILKDEIVDEIQLRRSFR